MKTINFNYLKKFNLLFVEDDELAVEFLSNILEYYFNKVFTASNIDQAFDLYTNNSVNIILTDMNMPGGKGSELVEKIRAENKNIPIIFLSAYKESDELLNVINLGISSYLIKPIEIEKLLNILYNHIVNKISHDDQSRNIYILPNGITIDLEKKIINGTNGKILLTKKEFLLLEYLIKNRGTLVKKDGILEYVWSGQYVSDGSLRSLLIKLRAKIGYDSISTVTNLGYTINLLSD